MGVYRNDAKNQNGRIGRLESTVVANKSATDVGFEGTISELEGKVTSDGGTFIVPVEDPGVAGALWYDTDTLKVSTGS